LVSNCAHEKYSHISFLVCCAVDLSWIFGWQTSWHYGRGAQVPHSVMAPHGAKPAFFRTCSGDDDIKSATMTKVTLHWREGGATSCCPRRHKLKEGSNRRPPDERQCCGVGGIPRYSRVRHHCQMQSISSFSPGKDCIGNRPWKMREPSG
jgi:hypothetical protein